MKLMKADHEAKCNLGKVKLETMLYRTSGVAQEIWQGLPWLRLQLHFTLAGLRSSFAIMLWRIIADSRSCCIMSVSCLFSVHWIIEDGLLMCNGFVFRSLGTSPSSLCMSCSFSVHQIIEVGLLHVQRIRFPFFRYLAQLAYQLLV